MTTKAPAFLTQVLLPSKRRLKYVSHDSESFREYRNLHDWLLNEDGAQRAASNKDISSSFETGSPDIARGDHLFINISSTRYSAFLCSFTFILLIISLLNLIH